MYKNPTHDAACSLTEAQLQAHFDLFYEDIFTELSLKYGYVEDMLVCDNLGDHLMGNIYVRFTDEESAARAVEDLNKRWYAAKPIFAELCPVTEFKDSCCRQYEMGECNRGGFCNFMHFKYPTVDLKKELVACQKETNRQRKQKI